MSFQSLQKGQSVYIQDDLQAAVHRDIKKKFLIRPAIYPWYFLSVVFELLIC